jgi:hypothetical protein
MDQVLGEDDLVCRSDFRQIPTSSVKLVPPPTEREQPLS